MNCAPTSRTWSQRISIHATCGSSMSCRRARPARSSSGRSFCRPTRWCGKAAAARSSGSAGYGGPPEGTRAHVPGALVCRVWGRRLGVGVGGRGMVQFELAGVGIEFVQLGVAAPVDGQVELLVRPVFAETATERVQEEVLAERPVAGRRQAVADGPDQWRPGLGLAGEDRLGGIDVPRGEAAPVVG